VCLPSPRYSRGIFPVSAVITVVTAVLPRSPLPCNPLIHAVTRLWRMRCGGQSKIEICKYRELGMCCTEGSITFDWTIEKSGFVCGEDVWIQGSVQNDSKYTVACSTVTFYMVFSEIVCFNCGRVSPVIFLTYRLLTTLSLNKSASRLPFFGTLMVLMYVTLHNSTDYEELPQRLICCIAKDSQKCLH